MKKVLYASYKKNIEIKISLYKKFKKDFNIENNILITGAARSGTTWLADILTERKTGLLWEPLASINFPQYETSLQHTELGHMPYIPENEKFEEASRYFQELFKGNLLTYYNIKGHPARNKNLFNRENWIIKFTRANMLLPWLTKNFDIMPIFIVRHPLSAIASSLSFFNIDMSPNSATTFQIQNSRYMDIFQKYEYLTSNINDKFELLANWWGMYNTIPLNHPENNKSWITVSYESLVNRPEFEIKRIFSRLNKEVPPDIMNKIKTKSCTVSKQSPLNSGENVLQRWKKTIQPNQISKILDIVNRYSIDAYTEELEPDYSKLGYN